MRLFVTAFAAISLLSAPAFAAPCRDGKGKFVKCPEKAVPAARKGPCKDAKGKFTKCPK